MDSENYFSNNGRIGKKNERFIDPVDKDATGGNSLPGDPGFLALQKEPARNKRQKNALLLRNETHKRGKTK